MLKPRDKVIVKNNITGKTYPGVVDRVNTNPDDKMPIHVTHKNQSGRIVTMRYYASEVELAK